MAMRTCTPDDRMPSAALADYSLYAEAAQDFAALTASEPEFKSVEQWWARYASDYALDDPDTEIAVVETSPANSWANLGKGTVSTTVSAVDGAPASPRAGAPSRPPFEIVPGVYTLDGRLAIGPSATPDYLTGVVAASIATAQVIRVHGPDIQILQRITLAAADHGRVAVFSLHLDGDRADVTIQPQ